MFCIFILKILYLLKNIIIISIKHQKKKKLKQLFEL
jgi:hypothetical protein